MIQGGLRTKGITKRGEPGNPLVSIITVVYNGEKHIEQTIESVLNQTYKNIEYIIIDGNSKDNTINILKKYDDKIDHWQSETDGGIYFAMNKGIELAKGEIIGIINADDYYLPDAVMNVISTNAKDPADIFYGDMRILSENKTADKIQKPDISKMDELPSISHPTCFVKRSAYEKAGPFDTRFKISSDYEFLLRCIRKNFKFLYISKIITVFRQGGLSGSCYSNVEGYKIMKIHKTGHHRAVIVRGIKCYVKTFLKKIIHLGRS